MIIATSDLNIFNSMCFPLPALSAAKAALCRPIWLETTDFMPLPTSSRFQNTVNPHFLSDVRQNRVISNQTLFSRGAATVNASPNTRSRIGKIIDFPPAAPARFSPHKPLPPELSPAFPMVSQSSCTLPPVSGGFLGAIRPFRGDSSGWRGYAAIRLIRL